MCNIKQPRTLPSGIRNVVIAVALASSFGTTVALANNQDDNNSDRHQVCIPTVIEGAGSVDKISSTYYSQFGTLAGLPQNDSTHGLRLLKRHTASGWKGFINSGTNPVQADQRIVVDTRVVFPWEAQSTTAPNLQSTGLDYDITRNIFYATVTDSVTNRQYKGMIEVIFDPSTIEGSSSNSPPNVPLGLGARTRQGITIIGLSGSLRGARGEGIRFGQALRVNSPSDSSLCQLPEYSGLLACAPGVVTPTGPAAGAQITAGYYASITLDCDDHH